MLKMLIDGEVFTFDYINGWKSETSPGSFLEKELTTLWGTHYGAEDAVYPLTVEGRHVAAVLKNFEGKIIEDTRVAAPTKEGVVY